MEPTLILNLSLFPQSCRFNLHPSISATLISVLNDLNCLHNWILSYHGQFTLFYRVYPRTLNSPTFTVNPATLPDSFALELGAADCTVHLVSDLNSNLWLGPSLQWRLIIHTSQTMNVEFHHFCRHLHKDAIAKPAYCNHSVVWHLSVVCHSVHSSGTEIANLVVHFAMLYCETYCGCTI